MSEGRTEYAVAKRDEVLFPSWEQMTEQATVLVKSGFFGKSVQKPEQAMAIMLAGRELGVPPMEAINSIYIVDGKPSCGAGLMAALILRSGCSYVINESTDKMCSITFKRRTGEVYTHEFTIEDAKRAGLTGKKSWQGYPKAMLYSRCMAAGARAHLPHVIKNMHTQEELGAPVEILSDEQIIEGQIVSEEPVNPTPEPEPEAPSDNGEEAPDAWGLDANKRRAFWAQADEMGLSNRDVHIATGRDSLKGCGMTMDEVLDKCREYVNEQVEATTPV